MSMDESLERENYEVINSLQRTARCACVAMDARECARIRDKRGATLDDEDDDFKHVCECVCHDEDEDNE